MSNNPHLSTRQIGSHSAVSKTNVDRILKHHVSRIVTPGAAWERFADSCTGSSIRTAALADRSDLVRNVLFADEAAFTNHWQENIINAHWRAAGNPQWLRQVQYQRQWNINVWGVVTGNRITGPYFTEGTLNVNRYDVFSLNVLPRLLEEILLRNQMWIWYKHDGCPARNATVAGSVSNRGIGGPRTWPVRSPDLTTFHFFTGKSTEEVSTSL